MNKLIQESHNEEIIRISVANLISDINGKIVWIVNKKWLKFWKKNISLVWWWAELFDKKFIENQWGFDFEWSDVRFKIPRNKLEEMLNLFSKYNPSIFEMDVKREVKEELWEEIIWDMIEPILSENECNLLNVQYRWVIYKEWFWNSEKRAVVTKYIMHLYSLEWPTQVLEKIFSNSVIHIIEQEDVLCWITKDGYKLWDNIIEAYNFNMKKSLNN